MAGHDQGKVQNLEKEEKSTDLPKRYTCSMRKAFPPGQFEGVRAPQRMWRGFHHLKCEKHRNGEQEPHTHTVGRVEEVGGQPLTDHHSE